MNWNRSDRIEVPKVGHVHVWKAAYGDWSDRLATLQPSLDQSEVDRASRFIHQSDRDRYVFAHGVLRRILAQCCDCRPGDLRFSTGAHDKPHLGFENRDEVDWQFNLSHSGDMVLVAVARGMPVGVDVERSSRAVEVESLSQRFFSTPESDHILSLTGVDRKRAFMDTWVCKEAFIKAVGEGLSMPLDSFTIGFDGEETQVMRTPGRDNPHLAQQWTIERFPVADDYAGAIAVPLRPVRVVGFPFE